ncbi:unnamed protein product [Amoebophrya sp. A25]|nr:unnamed protein product [Amoebophrya sp. A25]|eukprot:GSA25T00027345001.1
MPFDFPVFVQDMRARRFISVQTHGGHLTSENTSAWTVTGDVVTPHSSSHQRPSRPIGIRDWEVAMHNNIVLTTSGTGTNAVERSDIHIIVEHAGQKKVYDVTDYLPNHPGGVTYFQECAGVDCTQQILFAHCAGPFQQHHAQAVAACLSSPGEMLLWEKHAMLDPFVAGTLAPLAIGELDSRSEKSIILGESTEQQLSSSSQPPRDTEAGQKYKEHLLDTVDKYEKYAKALLALTKWENQVAFQRQRRKVLWSGQSDQVVKFLTSVVPDQVADILVEQQSHDDVDVLLQKQKKHLTAVVEKYGETILWLNYEMGKENPCAQELFHNELDATTTLVREVKQALYEVLAQRKRWVQQYDEHRHDFHFWVNGSRTGLGLGFDVSSDKESERFLSKLMNILREGDQSQAQADSTSEFDAAIGFLSFFRSTSTQRRSTSATSSSARLQLDGYERLVGKLLASEVRKLSQRLQDMTKGFSDQGLAIINANTDLKLQQFGAARRVFQQRGDVVDEEKAKEGEDKTQQTHSNVVNNEDGASSVKNDSPSSTTPGGKFLGHHLYHGFTGAMSTVAGRLFTTKANDAVDSNELLLVNRRREAEFAHMRAVPHTRRQDKCERTGKAGDISLCPFLAGQQRNSRP